MEQTFKIMRKLLDNFILPKFGEIMSYDFIETDNDEKLIIEFWMDGTEQELEEEIVDEFHNLQKYYGLSNLRVKFKFTTDGENFYEYN